MEDNNYIYVIAALLPLAACMVVFEVNPYHALVIRGILGAVAALVYAILGAADVALTEALVGTMLAITLYAVAVRSSLVMRVGVLQDELIAEKPPNPDGGQKKGEPESFLVRSQNPPLTPPLKGGEPESFLTSPSKGGDNPPPNPPLQKGGEPESSLTQASQGEEEEPSLTQASKTGESPPPNPPLQEEGELEPTLTSPSKEGELEPTLTSPSKEGEDDRPLDALIQEFRRIFRQYYMRIELVPYKDTEELHRALMDKEVHATCSPPEPAHPPEAADQTEDSDGLLVATKVETPAYQTNIRLQRLYEIMHNELASSPTILTYINPADSGEKH